MSCPVSDMRPHFPLQPNQSHWGYNPVQYVLVIITSCLSRIWFFGSITWTLGYFAGLILFAFTSSFLPSESHAGESLLSELSRGLRIWFFSFVFWTSEYLADLIFRTVSTPCGIEFHLSRFTYLIFCLYWRIQSFVLVSIPCVGESVTSQDSCIWSFTFTLSLLPSVPHARESLTCESLRIWAFTFTSSVLPSVSHAGESVTYKSSRIRSFAFVSILCGEQSHLSKGSRT